MQRQHWPLIVVVVSLASVPVCLAAENFRIGQYESELTRVEIGPCASEALVIAKYVQVGIFGDPGDVIVRLRREHAAGPIVDTAAFPPYQPLTGSLLALDSEPASTYVLVAQHAGVSGEVWISEVRLFARCI